jgi:hypothetical protein
MNAKAEMFKTIFSLIGIEVIITLLTGRHLESAFFVFISVFLVWCCMWLFSLITNYFDTQNPSNQNESNSSADFIINEKGVKSDTNQKHTNRKSLRLIASQTATSIVTMITMCYCLISILSALNVYRFTNAELASASISLGFVSVLMIIAGVGFSLVALPVTFILMIFRVEAVDQPSKALNGAVGFGFGLASLYGPISWYVMCARVAGDVGFKEYRNAPECWDVQFSFGGLFVFIILSILSLMIWDYNKQGEVFQGELFSNPSIYNAESEHSEESDQT